jgi:type I restriction enzyme S subunit
VPDGWAWCRLKEVCTVFGRIGFRGYTRDDLVEKGNGAITLSPSNLINMKLDLTDCTYISWPKYEESPEIQLDINDIVVVKTGSSYGKTSFVDNLTEKTTLNPQLMVLKERKCNSKYLCYFLNTQYMRKHFEDLVNGTAIPTFSQEKFGMKIFPLPPASEQEKIVSRIELIFDKIDLLENDKENLDTIIKQTKSKILDLAIHGKLVPQNPNDEPAEELLKRIATSDNRPYKKIDDAEVLFDIPKSWSWCTLGEIYTHTTGKALKKTNNKGTLRKYITTSNLYWNSFDFTEVREMYFTDDELEKCTIKKGDLILCNGGDVGRAAIWNYDYDICYQNHVSRLRPKNENINNSFFLYVIMTYKQQGMLNGKGVGITSLSASDLLSAVVPLPPYSEQNKIVEEIECLYGNLNVINNQL